MFLHLHYRLSISSLTYYVNRYLGKIERPANHAGPFHRSLTPIVNIAYCENIDNNSKPYHNHFPMHNEQNPAYIMPGPAIKLNVYFV